MRPGVGELLVEPSEVLLADGDARETA